MSGYGLNEGVSFPTQQRGTFHASLLPEGFWHLVYLLGFFYRNVTVLRTWDIGAVVAETRSCSRGLGINK